MIRIPTASGLTIEADTPGLTIEQIASETGQSPESVRRAIADLTEAGLSFQPAESPSARWKAERKAQRRNAKLKKQKRRARR